MMAVCVWDNTTHADINALHNEWTALKYAIWDTIMSNSFLYILKV